MGREATPIGIARSGAIFIGVSYWAVDIKCSTRLECRVLMAAQNLRDHGLSARVASWTRQSAIHGTQHATRPTTTPPTHIGGNLQRPLAREPRLAAFVITAWALEWLPRPDNQQSTAPTTPLAQPLHHRPTSAATRNARSGSASRKRLRDHGLGAQVASWTRQSAIHGT